MGGWKYVVPVGPEQWLDITLGGTVPTENKQTLKFHDRGVTREEEQRQKFSIFP